MGSLNLIRFFLSPDHILYKYAHTHTNMHIYIYNCLKWPRELDPTLQEFRCVFYIGDALYLSTFETLAATVTAVVRVVDLQTATCRCSSISSWWLNHVESPIVLCLLSRKKCQERWNSNLRAFNENSNKPQIVLYIPSFQNSNFLLFWIWDFVCFIFLGLKKARSHDHSQNFLAESLQEIQRFCGRGHGLQ